MNITQSIFCDLSTGITLPSKIPVMAGDSGTRFVAIRLLANSEEWIVPEGVTASLAYEKRDGTSGWYDTLPDGEAACAIDGNIVTVELAPQVMAVPGIVQAALVLRGTDGEQLSTFEFYIDVKSSPAGAEPNGDYYRLRGVVHSVNGKTPDANGNVEITGSSSGQNVNPVAKTEDMTQPVGVDGDGRLWVAPIGGGSGGDTTTHGIVWDLVNVTSSNPIASVSDGASIVATLTAESGYTLGDVTVTMGGEVLTGVWNADTATVTIASVTGDVVISCAGVELREVTENLKNVAGYSTNDVMATLYTNAILNADGETFATTLTGIIDDASSEAQGNYYVTYFGQEVSGGNLCIDFDTSLITKLETKIAFTNAPVTPVFGTSESHSIEKMILPVGYSGTEGNVTITGYSTKNAWYSVNITGKFYVDVPDGYYPIVSMRRSGTVIADETINSNALATKYFYDNVAVTHTSVPAESEASALPIDADYAMDYGVSTAALVTDDAATDSGDLDTAFAEAVEDAKNAWLTEANGNIDKIPLIIHTDQHSNFNKPLWDFISKIVDWYDVGKVINLGDTVNSYGGDLLSDSGLESYIESMASVPYSKRIEVFGNHDTWGNNEDGTGRFTPQNYLHKYFRNIYARRFDNHGNFVTYDDNYNVKYVVVSGFAYDSDKGGYSHYIIPSATIDRIIAELEKADGYDVILLSHVPLLGVNFKSLADLWSGRKGKSSGSVTDEYGVPHAFDFTNCDGELLCGLHGHNHEDGCEYIGDLLDVWFDAYYIQPRAIHFVLIDRENRRLNVWKADNTPQVQNYQIPLDKPAE